MYGGELFFCLFSFTRSSRDARISSVQGTEGPLQSCGAAGPRRCAFRCGPPMTEPPCPREVLERPYPIGGGGIRHQQEHRLQRPSERSAPTQHAEGRTGDYPGPAKKQQPDGMSRRGSNTPPPPRPPPRASFEQGGGEGGRGFWTQNLVYQKWPDQIFPIVNHLEERLLDQAQARASYTPLFWGHSRSIPQGMILDVQPLVKSLFCPIRASPNGFFDFEASTP